MHSLSDTSGCYISDLNQINKALHVKFWMQRQHQNIREFYRYPCDCHDTIHLVTLLSLFLPKRKKSYLQLPVITCRREIYLCLPITTWLYLIWFRTIELPVVPLWSSCSVDYPLVVRHFTWNYLSVHEISVLNRGYRKMA